MLSSNGVYLSVIIPAYNEEKRLPKTLKAIFDYLKNQDYQWEIIVVNSGSTDRTAEIVKEMVPEIKNLKLIELDGLGKGSAVKAGMLAAQGEYRVFTDADNSTSIDQIEKMWPEFKTGFDIIIGSRDVKGAILNPPQPFFRKIILGGGFKSLRKIIIDLWDISDTQCGFKGFTERAVKDIFSKLTIMGFAFDVEVLILAKKMGYKTKEIPVRWINDPDSKIKLKHIIKMLVEILKIRWNLIKRRVWLKNLKK